MGRNASSSKRKSSKRKSSKLSSEDRKRKRSRKIKSKKLRHHDDSSYSDDDLMSSVSVSSTSSEDDYKSRKVQSRSRSDARSGKKKSRKRSPSPMRSEDPSRTKKRKRLDNDLDSKLKKKSRKIKHKRKRSISSTRSDSSDSSEESEPERHRGRSRERRISKRDPLKTKAGNRKGRSPSCSSCSRSSHHSRSVSPSIEQILVHNESRRLKSVISVVEHRYEIDDNEPEKNLYEEEIVYDRYDYPSSRSNDTHDGVSRRKSTNFSRVASEEEITLSNLRKKDLIEVELDCSGQLEGVDSYRLKTTIPEKENEAEISVTVAGSGNDDLELILRQKALENLRRFREEKLMKSKATNCHNKNWLSAAVAEDVHEKSLKFDASNEQCPATDIEKSDNPILERDLTDEPEIRTNNSGGGKTENDHGLNELNDIPKPLSGISYAVNEKYESGFSAPGQENLSSCSEVKQAITSSIPFDSNLMATKSIAIEKAPHRAPSLSPGVRVDNICSSTSEGPKKPCGESTSAEHSSKEHQDKSKDGSQFEKKTMSVMRGGEMVQVNYKVYIPKKVPALARRQLKR